LAKGPDEAVFVFFLLGGWPHVIEVDYFYGIVRENKDVSGV